ncbi:Uncharacterised protein [Delftia tsuruhatensis]|nr:Uncharacterised protein [Delftia tsuruhatensis]
MARGAIRLGLSYEYILDADKKLSDYNMEAQGNIVADYFVLKYLKKKKEAISNDEYFGEEWIPIYESLLADFLENPCDKKNNLP